MAQNFVWWLGQKIKTYGSYDTGHFMASVDSTTAHIHEGYAYDSSGSGTIPVAGYYAFLANVGSIPLHFHGLTVDVDAGPVTIDLIEAPTVSAAGSAYTPRNRNRAFTDTSGATVTMGATITGGTVLFTHTIHAIGGGAHTQGGEAGGQGEWVLKPNTYYALKITGADGTAFNAKFFYYELDL